ncbi:MAG TPA: hypothetical protein DC006_06500 [Prevotellaceae bacterium]|nr:hypothetical protein [Prevotellaceae bacterium]HBE55345.1 hypothetical protein [Prevotellaceae bacterium]
MSFLNRLFGRKQQAGSMVGGMEDFMLLIRVYYQSSIAAQLGISNLAALPDLRVFKQTYHVPTVNNKLGLGEKKQCRRMIQDIYAIPDDFFKEIDASMKRHCRKPQDVQPYLAAFQGFSQDLMMLMGNLMQWKFRLPSFLHKTLRGMVAKQVHQVLTRVDWKDEGVRKACVSIRRYQAMLDYSERWMTEYVYTLVMLAKKEPRKNGGE